MVLNGVKTCSKVTEVVTEVVTEKYWTFANKF